jgi:hypothetical protein
MRRRSLEQPSFQRKFRVENGLQNEAGKNPPDCYHVRLFGSSGTKADCAWLITVTLDLFQFLRARQRLEVFQSK